MKQINLLSLLGALVLGMVFTACSNVKEFEKSPVDDLIRDMDKEQNFTILLYDMDSEGSWSPTYKHKYKVITEGADSVPKERITDWYEVDELFFDMHANDMGMEIAAKVDGKVTKETSPPGYSRYVGNSQYGHWNTNSSGDSFWEFYGKYAMISSMVGLMTGPIYRTGYYDYHSNYRGVRPYYGSGSQTYGTFSDASRQSNPDFHKRLSSNSTFKDRVNGSVSRSSAARTTRSGSRYSSGSSRSRSSSGGGK
jgi:hypothetical protein